MDVAAQIDKRVKLFNWRIYSFFELRKYLKEQETVRLNIGCGKRTPAGWVNADVNRRGENAIYMDCTKGLPFADQSVTTIFMEHVFEHFEYYSEGLPLLKECRRCLRKGGVLRVIVPDVGRYLSLYEADWDQMLKLRGMEDTSEGWRDPWIGDIYETKMQLLNAVFYQRGEHKASFDEETLVLALRSAGFSDVRVSEFGKSVDPDAVLDSKIRERESLYVEAVA